MKSVFVISVFNNLLAKQGSKFVRGLNHIWKLNFSRGGGSLSFLQCSTMESESTVFGCFMSTQAATQNILKLFSIILHQLMLWLRNQKVCASLVWRLPSVPCMRWWCVWGSWLLWVFRLARSKQIWSFTDKKSIALTQSSACLQSQCASVICLCPGSKVPLGCNGVEFSFIFWLVMSIPLTVFHWAGLPLKLNSCHCPFWQILQALSLNKCLWPVAFSQRLMLHLHPLFAEWCLHNSECSFVSCLHALHNCAWWKHASC